MVKSASIISLTRRLGTTGIDDAYNKPGVCYAAIVVAVIMCLTTQIHKLPLINGYEHAKYEIRDKVIGPNLMSNLLFVA